ncbi:protein spaetzle 4-like [Uloborus diversus]|uniref:protein spaetzle 4-like n=1 Tax=Uloborus diversus TaxID=327109 RepID=UPI00240A7DB1|nr:protein spaetzle 4-like [Uloborus diversus]
MGREQVDSTRVLSQSCGPRVSARLLAEIPCDMSKSSYCSAPGSAYPWSSVKRYINDNQGLVRRMYGDEKHSSVLLNEIDSFKAKFDMLQATIDSTRSRTVYGRSARAGNYRRSHRQPRPQIFKDDTDELQVDQSTADTPATIFRVVTETSIKVGDVVTPSMMSGETKIYDPITERDDSTGSIFFTSRNIPTTATETVATTTEPVEDLTINSTETQFPTESSTVSDSTTASPDHWTTHSINRDSPVAMERVSYDDDYDYEPRRKMEPSVLQNSVEEKISPKPEEMKRTSIDKLKETIVITDDDLDIDASIEEGVREDNETIDKTQEKDEEEKDEEVPRRGINACPVKNEVIAPYWANNTRGETLALLNVHPFEQYVHFEKCAFENHQMLCREGCRCEQQYRLHRLLAFDPKNECRGIFSDWFRFPSCCVCICYDLTPDIPRTRSRKGRM